MSEDRHLDREEIEQYSMGKLAEGQAARIEEHLLCCEACRKLVIESDGYIAAVRSAAERICAVEKELEPRVTSPGQADVA